MPVLFQSKVGSVVQLDDPVAQCDLSRSVLDIEPIIDWNNFRAIVTRVTVSQQVNVQFLHTMGSMVYVYVFGDRIGGVSLSGLSFYLCECPEDEENEQEDIYLWYKTNRVSKRKEPVRVTIGQAVIEGFVTGFTEDVVDPSLSLVQWGVNLSALPDDD
jgi:hypothetical protein